MARPYPFSAIVGQEEMKQALLVAAVHPGVGGVLVLGHRGTGKSTAVRALRSGGRDTQHGKLCRARSPCC